MTMFGNGYGRRGGGFSGRILIGIVMALVALGTYYMSGQKNPFTGETQRVGMNVKQEMALGIQARQQMADQMGGAADPGRNRDAAFVEEVGQRLAQSVDEARNPYRSNYHFFLLNDTHTINAFALPGGQIFITRALFDKLENEAELAGVLGHEIGHVIHRHSAEQMAKGQLGQSLVTAVGVGASDNYSTAQMATMAASMVNNIRQLSFSRQDELEADEFGLWVTSQNGLSPAAMLNVMAILKEASGKSGGSDMFKTHPDPDARIQRIKDYLARNFANSVPGNLTNGRSLR